MKQKKKQKKVLFLLTLLLGIFLSNLSYGQQRANIEKEIKVSGEVTSGKGKVEILGVTFRRVGGITFPEKVDIKITDHDGGEYFFSNVPKTPGAGNVIYENHEIKVELKQGKVCGHFLNGCCIIFTFEG